MNQAAPKPDVSATMDWIRARVNANDFFNSEHIVRYLTQRIFSMQDIRQVLLSGAILEIHSHPLRSPAFLVLGYSDDEAIHLACARDPDDNLIILYVIKKVPAGLCVQCGEKYISAQASEKIVAKIENEAFIEKDEVRVFDYEK